MSEDTPTQSISEYLIAKDLPKLKSSLSFYVNERYERPWYKFVRQLEELNYDALMHGMIYNEMVSCIKLVENTNWTSIIEVRDKSKNLFKINLLSSLTGDEHRFYKDPRLVEYINIVQIKIGKDETEFEFPIVEKYFADSYYNSEYSLYVMVKIEDSKCIDYFKQMRENNANLDIKCKLLIDRSMFYLMHYAVDNTNKSILFPPRIDNCNLNIEESIDIKDGKYKYKKHITLEQKTIIERILKEKTGLLVPPVSAV